MVTWEIIRYKCQLKGTNNRWKTTKICFNQEEAEMWLMAEIKYGLYPSRVIKEELMRI